MYGYDDTKKKLPLSVDDHVILVLDVLETDLITMIKMTEKAVRVGFRHPFISSKFFERTFDRPHLFLYHKYNHNYGRNVDNKQYDEVMKHIRFCRRNYTTLRLREGDKYNSCKIHITLDPDAIKYLHDYAKTFRFNFEGGKGGQREISGKGEQREISGKLLLYETVDNHFLVKVDEKSANLGGKEQTASTDTVASFHTHPKDAYHKYKVCMAWPSIDDYETFLSIYANGYGMFHILGTVEGIYVITISEKLMKEGREKILEKFDYYSGQIDKKYHSDYPTCDVEKADKSIWEKKKDKYLKDINALKYFHVQFIYWDDAGKPINIHYKDNDGNCVISDEQVKFNDLLQKDKNTSKINHNHNHNH
jgi:hypothetical protein